MKPRILLVNPPIYDFAAYDFWLRPYGLLNVAGRLRGRAELRLFDYLDRFHPSLPHGDKSAPDRWGRGRFAGKKIPKPEPLAGIRRFFRRFGVERRVFRDFLRSAGPFDFALIQTVMTYWYPGIREVIEDVRAAARTKIVLGGNYATLCPGHAAGLGADLVLAGADLDPLWQLLGLVGDPQQPALWEAYGQTPVGVLKLSDGCPFRCTYCSVPTVYGRFRARPLERSLAELDLLVRCGAANVAFYDDALLCDADHVLTPFLERTIERTRRPYLHTPNALNARLLTPSLARQMVRAGFRTFYLGFESVSAQWQRDTGGKVLCEELAAAVRNLIQAGADPSYITAYQILGHPDSNTQEIEASMRFVRSLGIRGMLADFSPIPGTPDGDRCSRWVDMDEPLMHNNTAFCIIRLGFDESNRLKDLQRQLNRTLTRR